MKKALSRVILSEAKDQRQRSIRYHQPDGVAHLGCFAALRMTCPGHFLMACYEHGFRRWPAACAEVGQGAGQLRPSHRRRGATGSWLGGAQLACALASKDRRTCLSWHDMAPSVFHRYNKILTG